MQRERVRIAPGIYRDAYGLAATVKVGGIQREKRFPHDASIKTIKAWQGETRVALRKLAPQGARGTFAADAGRYLQSVAAMPTIKERRAHVALWIAEFGQRARHTIGTPDIDAVLNRWLLKGKAPSTVRNRRTALLHLWNRLDGPDAQNPVRRATKPRMAEPEARALTYDEIRKILAAMPDRGQGVKGKARDDASKTKARLAVIAYTGLPHSLLKRLRAADVDSERRTITVPARKKGKGVGSRVLPLTDAGAQAFERFAELECWGGFSNSSMMKSFHRACKTAGVREARVYDLRHSFATEMYRQTGDSKATAELLMHSPTSRMMDRYTLAGVAPRLLVAVKAFDAVNKKTAGSLGWQPRAQAKRTA
ncbi:MAG TPA: tyrosine-type recombinase/integrase [Vicinamibacterales bacterium]|nr:tyrosine-type recombinase/integrase [Vicinamibacterales bacterium]